MNNNPNNLPVIPQPSFRPSGQPAQTPPSPPSPPQPPLQSRPQAGGQQAPTAAPGFGRFDKTFPAQPQDRPFEAGEVKIYTMHSDIAQLQSKGEDRPDALRPISSRPTAPAGSEKPAAQEGSPPQFVLEDAGSIIAESLKKERQKKITKIAITAFTILAVVGAAGFAVYAWLLPTLEPKISPPPAQPAPIQPAPTTPGEQPSMVQPTEPLPATPPSLPASMLMTTQGLRQIDLEMASPTKQELTNNLNQQAALLATETISTLEIFVRLPGETNFLGWGRFAELFMSEVSSPSGLGERFSVLIDKTGRAIAVELTDEAAATAWLDAAGNNLAKALAFLFQQSPQGEFGQFRQGRAIAGVGLHRFAATSNNLSIDYGLAGNTFIAATNIDTFTNLIKALSSQ